MEEEDRRRIAANRRALLQSITFRDLIPFLTQKHILSEAQVEEIENCSLKNEDQVQALLTELEQPWTTPAAFKQFIECLLETGHGEAAALIHPDVDVQEFGSNSTPPPALNDQPRLLVKKAERIRQEPDCYKMTSRPRGFWVLINNHEFKGKEFEKRKGSEKDAERMEEVAADLGFEVKSKANLAADEIYELLQDVSRDPDLVKHDALFVNIMSHGENDMIIGSDGVALHVHDIKSLFNSHNCPALVSKPKVFIFVSCRGADFDGPLTRSKSLTDQPNFFESSFEQKYGATGSGDVDGQCSTTRRSRRPSGRLVDDTLTAYSTVPGFVSHRHPENGTYYIAILARFLMEKSCTDHLVKILTKVDNEFREHVINEEYMQTPGFEHTGFNKKLFFNPGFYQGEG